MSSAEQREERIALSWFFRFWTNFASAPSLSFWSVAIPFAILYRVDESGHIGQVSSWLLPGLCYAGSMLLSFVIKRVFKRMRPPRPGKAFGYKLKDPSFPSGHSLTSFCFWVMFTLVLVQSSVFSSLGIVLLSVIALSIVLLTGLSRIYLGVHFPSDVLGGYTIGAVWCVACYFALNPILNEVLEKIS
jgi:membrane-associated phospholipid phosphatase